MGQVLHGSARTTPAVRRLIQQSPESLQSLAARHGINPKTVAKWRSRTTTAGAPMGPKAASTVLTAAEQAIAVAFRQHTQLPLDDCLYALQESMRWSGETGESWVLTSQPHGKSSTDQTAAL